jgi:hypothetical protein
MNTAPHLKAMTTSLLRGEVVGFSLADANPRGSQAFSLQYALDALKVRNAAGEFVGLFVDFDAAWRAGEEAAGDAQLIRRGATPTPHSCVTIPEGAAGPLQKPQAVLPWSRKIVPWKG